MTAVVIAVAIVGTVAIIGPFVWICWLTYLRDRAEIEAWKAVNEASRLPTPKAGDDE